jgi:hypothetical protein
MESQIINAVRNLLAVADDVRLTSVMTIKVLVML